MKNITIYLYKFVIIATSLVMVYFATGIAAIAQATELVKVEPIKHESFVSQAQDNLALTFPTLNITFNTAQHNAKDMIAMETNTVLKNQEISLNKINLVSE